MSETEHSLPDLAPAYTPEQSDLTSFDEEELKPRPLRWPSRRRIGVVFAILLLLVLLFVLPPLVNVNRYRKQIASSISLSLGRPVRIDSVELTMLPTPGFILQTFIVGEDPAFGAEPVLRADSVRVSLRPSSLWRRHVEFSRIILKDPSVNLVHLPDGRWNLESILLQASRMPAAPTAQKTAGRAPRFPYIEATGARINLKMGIEKMPLSLTDAKLALWLPQPEQWHLRLEAHPSRTDGPALDTGLVRLEGTLGKASTLPGVPVDLQASWTAAPLGAVSAVLMGHDGGMRGDLNVTAAVKGTAGANILDTHLELHRLRRADFVPEHPLDIDLRCAAQAANLLRSLTAVNCSWPAGPPDSGLHLTGDVPNVMDPRTISATVQLKDVSASVLLDALRVASRRTSPDLAATGAISGSITDTQNTFAGSLAVAAAKVQLGPQNLIGDDLSATLSESGAAIAPFAVALGGPTPARLEAALTPAGYQLHLTGTALRSKLLQLAEALPTIGEGLPEALQPAPASLNPTLPEQPITLDLTSTRAWAGPQIWVQAAPPRIPTARRKPRRH